MVTVTERRRGRAARIQHRQANISSQLGNSHRLIRKIPTYNLLSDESLEQLDHHAEWILQEIGVEFIDDTESLQLFKIAGASVKGTRVRFDLGLVKSLCATAPNEFTMHGRTPQSNIVIGNNHVVLSPSYGSPFVYDMDNGRRYGTITDFENFVKLTYSSPWLQHSGGTVCEPVNIAVNKRHLDMVYAHLKYSTKPFMGSVTAPGRAQDSIDMASIVYGKNYLEQHCVIQGNINVNSPLQFDSVMTGALKAYARANQAVVLSPFIIGGAMGPVTSAALIAQAHAEAMVGIALGQLVRPGSPVIYGNFLTTINLKTGAPTFGTPEANQCAMVIGQLSRRLGLPFRCGGQLTASKTADAQAAQESSDFMLAGLMSGANFILHAAGWLEGGLTIGYEKFMIDLDHCAMMHHFLQGISIDQNQLATDAYRQTQPGMNFLGNSHTLKNFENANYMSPLADTQSFEQWSEQGKLTIEQRANLQWKQALNEYQAPPLDEAIDEQLRDFIQRKKAASADAWY